MISKQKLKYVNSLQIKKFRQEHQSFLVEGAKNILELLNSDFEVELLAVTENFHEQNRFLLQKFPVEIIPQTDLEKTGSLQSNNAGIAVAKMKNNNFLKGNENEVVLVLDDIKDPGNLGTIIRIADWYGIQKIICSETCVEFYNPKVISASMGSFTRVRMYYCELEKYLDKIDNTAIYGAFLNGENIHQLTFPRSAYLILGNESNGISNNLEKYVTLKITIPKFGGAESLNVGIATAIILDNIYR